MRVTNLQPVAGALGATPGAVGHDREKLVVVAARDRQQAAALARMVRSAGGAWQVEATSDPYLAGRLVGEKRPAVLLLDLDLPGVDAWAVCRRLAAGRTDSGTPPAVLLLGRTGSQYERDRAGTCGARAYIRPPVRPGPLRAILDRVRAAATTHAAPRE